MARRRNKGEERQIVARRLDALLASARAEALGPDADLADRHAAIATHVSRRYQMPLRPHQKTQVCRACKRYRRAATTRVRIHRGRLITTCQCGHVHRRPLS